MNTANNWQKLLDTDPVPLLLDSGEKAIVHFTLRDLLKQSVPPVETIRDLHEAKKLLKNQQDDGSWDKPGKTEVYPPWHYKLVETFKRFRILVERYGFTSEHRTVSQAAEYLFSCQTDSGDIRGFIGNQYATYYTGYVLSLLIKSGYARDSRVEKGMQWLLSMRQNDGGWTIPILTHQFDRDTGYKLTSQNMEPVEPDREKPFSHNWTDMALRAFAAHPEYRKTKEARYAGELLKSTLFQPDYYASYQSPRYWTRFVFWWPSLLTALESLYLLGFTADDEDIKAGLRWFIDNQQPDGLWKLESHKLASPRDWDERLWLALSVCRLLKNYNP
jgi:hypothetical protein